MKAKITYWQERDGRFLGFLNDLLARKIIRDLTRDD
jgi:hypothetical protein